MCFEPKEKTVLDCFAESFDEFGINAKAGHAIVRIPQSTIPQNW